MNRRRPCFDQLSDVLFGISHDVSPFLTIRGCDVVPADQTVHARRNHRLCRLAGSGSSAHKLVAVTTEFDVQTSGGRTVHAYDSGPPNANTALTVLWHHGTPQTGKLLEPLLAMAEQHGVRWLSYDRPAYGGSSPRPGRDVAAAAKDVRQIADHLGIERFAVMGASGGGPHALACAALLPDRVLAVACLAGLAPWAADGLDWFAGMAAGGDRRASCRRRRASGAATRSRDHRLRPGVLHPGRLRSAGKRVVVTVGSGGFGHCRRPRRDDRRRPGLRGAMGLRSRAGRRADAGGARRAGSGGAQLARSLAGRALPRCGAVAAPGRRSHLGTEQLQCGYRVARRTGGSVSYPRSTEGRRLIAGRARTMRWPRPRRRWSCPPRRRFGWRPEAIRPSSARH